MVIPVNAVVDEAIRYEHNLAVLYQVFSTLFEDDAELWWDLSVSEEKHANLLESGRTLFDEDFARDTVQADLDALRTSNASLESLVERFQGERPKRDEAFQIALDLEKDANEHTLHELLDISPSRRATELVEGIRAEDSRHERKIRDYAARCGITV